MNECNPGGDVINNEVDNCDTFWRKVFAFILLQDIPPVLLYIIFQVKVTKLHVDEIEYRLGKEIMS